METAMPGGPGGPVVMVPTQQMGPSPGPMWADLVSARWWQECFRLGLPGWWKTRRLLARTTSGGPEVEVPAQQWRQDQSPWPGSEPMWVSWVLWHICAARLFRAPTCRRVWQGAKPLVEKTVTEMSVVVKPAQQ